MRAATAAAAAIAAMDLPPIVYDGGEPLPTPDPDNKPQVMACEVAADILIYGGGAGGGKSWWGNQECLKGYSNPDHRALMLRRTLTQAKKPKGMWDESSEMYRAYGAHTRQGEMDHRFPSGATITVGGCEHEKDKYNYDSSQLSVVFFDQLEQFTESIFWYIAMSRSRSAAGIKTRVRGSCNPIDERNKIGGWLCKMVMDGGWVSRDTGEAIPEMAGVVKWFYRVRDSLKFYDTANEAREANPEMVLEDVDPISMAFVPAKLSDNKFLDGEYRSKMFALPWMERQRLIGCNWKVSSAGGGNIKREWIRKLSRDPSGGNPDYWSCMIRSWDLAATEGGRKDKTAGILSGRSKKTGRIVYMDPITARLGPGAVDRLIIETAIKDGPRVVVRLPIDPGQAGKGQAPKLVIDIRAACAVEGVEPPPIVCVRPARSKTKGVSAKLDRGRSLISAVEPPLSEDGHHVEIYGNIDFVDGEGVDDWIDELHHFDGTDGGEDDCWDATVDGYNEHVKRMSHSGFAVL